MKKTITKRALTQRLNRELGKDGKTLRHARTAIARKAVGAWFITDAENVVACSVNPQRLARQMGLLKPYEALA